VDRFLLFPLLAPAVLLAAGNDAFGFDLPGYLDPFVYVGYFWHYPEHLWVFDDNSNYKISRLPWILPGYVLHAWMGPIVASYLLAYFTMALGAAALYLLVRDCLNDRGSAAIVSVAWACCTWGHGNGGWNYHVLIASGYYLMACWLVVRMARAPSSGRIALFAGVFFAAAVHTHLFLIVFAPLVAVLYICALPTEATHKVALTLKACGLVLAGGVALTALLAVVNRATGGTWLYFMPQVEQAMRVTNPDYDHWWKGNASQWLPSARYLVMPLAMMFAGSGALLVRRPRVTDRLLWALVGLAWAALVIMCYFQLARRLTTLDYSYVAFVLYPHAFACLAVAFADEKRRAWIAALIAVVIVGTLALLMPTLLPAAMERLMQALGLARFGAIVGPFVFGLVGAGVMLSVRGTVRAVVFAVWFSILNAWIAPVPSAYGLGTPGYLQSMLKTFHEADRVTAEIDPTLIGIKYWKSDEAFRTAGGEVPLANVFDSFVATRAWFTNLLGRTSPSPPIDQLRLVDLERAACVGVLSSIARQAELQHAMEAHFASLDRPLRAVAVRHFEDGGFSFALAVLKPIASPDDGPAPCVPRGVSPRGVPLR
jgi:hypothetical protein